MAPKKKQPLGVADANVRPQALAAAKMKPTVPALRDDNENCTPGPLTSKSKKRKPVDAPVTTAPAPKKAKAAKPTPDMLDVSGVELDGEDTLEVPVFDTCDTIRRKIRAMLRKDGVTQAAFLRAIAATAFPNGRKIQAKSFNDFMRQKGPLVGNCNGTFYASYVFFEKLRIKQGKPKSEDRWVMHERHPGGVDIKHKWGQQAYVVSVDSLGLSADRYGSVFSY